MILKYKLTVKGLVECFSLLTTLDPESTFYFILSSAVVSGFSVDLDSLAFSSKTSEYSLKTILERLVSQGLIAPFDIHT